MKEKVWLHSYDHFFQCDLSNSPSCKTPGHKFSVKMRLRQRQRQAYTRGWAITAIVVASIILQKNAWDAQYISNREVWFHTKFDVNGYCKGNTFKTFH